MVETSDFLVIGTGIAGLSFALRAARHGTVTILTKDEPGESNSVYAQGGIAAVWSEDDTFDDHVHDTLVAGAGLCRPEAVAQTVREGPQRVQELIELGARFTRWDDDPSKYDLHREGGHSRRRILHAADLTGREIVRALTEACAADPRIRVLDHHVAVDLITRRTLARRRQEIPPHDDEVLGAYALDQRTGTVGTHAARFVLLATGGAGRLYRFTTNPRVATGDGMAMAWRAGARMANLEFIQFHPTSLYHHKLQSFLVTEALRGEGGTLVLPSGERFMPRYDERAELAPRDVVARAIDAELKRRGLECVYLDMTHRSRDELQGHFPNIFSTLASVGLDMSTDPIPVVPAAHYVCGGVQTDLHGCTSLSRLLAVGEVSCTGLHGANRLASNSLLEAVVFAEKAAGWCEAHLAATPLIDDLPTWESGRAAEPDELVVVHQVWQEIRSFMWNYVGIVRTHRRMKRARRRIEMVKEEIEAYYWDFKVTTDLVELRNLADVADMVVQCALLRRESRGLHYTLDFPESDPRFLRDTVIQRWVD
ncbi:MAG: L-aspartate oxidase [Alphaproteobacteria bacterium]|nr:L-aspartate oxidase [Alphaproteobacteria bacterium]